MPRRLAVVADESGNAGEALQVLAGISGAAPDLLALERLLRRELARHGLRELKWAGLRKRKERFAAAAAFLGHFAKATASGTLAADLLVVQGGRTSQAFNRLQKEERWMAMYGALISRARRRHKGRLSLYPDQRTGMPWQRLRRAATLRSVRETSSGVLALVQLADLLAGLLRFSRLPAGEGEKESAGHLARLKRRELIRDFASLCAAFRLGPRLDEAGALVCPRGGRIRIWEITKLEGRRGKS